MKKLLRKVIPKIFDYNAESEIRNNKNLTAVIYSIDRIGDAIACSIAIDAIRKYCKNAKIIVICSRYSSTIFQSDPNIICYEIKNSNALLSITKAAFEIKNMYGKVDLLFSPTAGNKIPPNIFMGILRARCNIVVEKSTLMMHQPEHGSTLNGSLFSMYKKELEKYGLSAQDRPSIVSREAAIEKKESFLKAIGIDNYIIINLDAFDKKRCFPSTIVKEIKYQFKEGNVNYIIVCPPEKIREYKYIYNADSHIFIYDNVSSIHDNIAILKDAKLIVSPDTALIHIASAFNIPTIAVYRDQHNAKYWPPVSDKNESIIIEEDLNTCNEKKLSSEIVIKINILMKAVTGL